MFIGDFPKEPLYKNNRVTDYQKQCEAYHDYLGSYIDRVVADGESVIVEGTHLDPVFMEKTLKRFGI